MATNAPPTTRFRVHLITVGAAYTPPPGGGTDVIDALVEDLRSLSASRGILFATEEAQENAERLARLMGWSGPNADVRLLSSAHSLDEAYQAVNAAIADLLAEGIPCHSIMLHYTMGTKVVSAGALLAALHHEVGSLRYLYSPGRGLGSQPITTSPGAILADREIRLACELMTEMRFRSAREVLIGIDLDPLTDAQRATVAALRTLSVAYAEWDHFRVAEFLRHYRSVAADLEQLPALADFKVSPTVLQALASIEAVSAVDGDYPEELLLDLVNNALRRLVENRPDDAITRLHRAAEMYAQGLLGRDYGIRTDDVDIRKVPPRHRSAYEAERRVDDATIKIGLRRSYELLALLGHPVGAAFSAPDGLSTLLKERRHLVLAHGTRPASMRLALRFLREVEYLMGITMGDVHRRCSELQFPWVDSDAMMRRLEQGRQSDSPVRDARSEPLPTASPAAPIPAAKPGAAKPGKGDGKQPRAAGAKPRRQKP